MMNEKSLKGAIFSSDRQDWGTPQAFMKYLEIYFAWKPTLDASASEINYKAPKYFTIEDDGLSQDWGDEQVWLNPPFGRELPLWLKKCRETASKWNSRSTGSIYCLIPARPDTKWFHDIVVPSATEVYFIKGRFNFDLKHEGMKGNAPFPSMLVIWRYSHEPYIPALLNTLIVDKKYRGFEK